MAIEIGTIMAFLILMFIIIVIDCIDTSIPLAVIGFVSIAVSWNLSIIFGLTSADLSGFGQLIVLGYWITVVFAFGKIIVSSYDLKKKQTGD